MHIVDEDEGPFVGFQIGPNQFSVGVMHDELQGNVSPVHPSITSAGVALVEHDLKRFDNLEAARSAAAILNEEVDSGRIIKKGRLWISPSHDDCGEEGPMQHFSLVEDEYVLNPKGIHAGEKIAFSDYVNHALTELVRKFGKVAALVWLNHQHRTLELRTVIYDPFSGPRHYRFSYEPSYPDDVEEDDFGPGDLAPEEVRDDFYLDPLDFDDSLFDDIPTPLYDPYDHGDYYL